MINPRATRDLAQSCPAQNFAWASVPGQNDCTALKDTGAVIQAAVPIALA